MYVCIYTYIYICKLNERLYEIQLEFIFIYNIYINLTNDYLRSINIYIYLLVYKLNERLYKIHLEYIYILVYIYKLNQRLFKIH